MKEETHTDTHTPPHTHTHTPPYPHIEYRNINTPSWAFFSRRSHCMYILNWLNATKPSTCCKVTLLVDCFNQMPTAVCGRYSSHVSIILCRNDAFVVHRCFFLKETYYAFFKCLIGSCACKRCSKVNNLPLKLWNSATWWHHNTSPSHTFAQFMPSS